MALFPAPLKGVSPCKSSYKNIPNVHQSTALSCPSPRIISSARYSCVPTKDIDLTFVGSPISSRRRRPTMSQNLTLIFYSFFEGKMRGKKLEGCMQPCTTCSSSIFEPPTTLLEGLSQTLQMLKLNLKPQLDFLRFRWY